MAKLQERKAKILRYTGPMAAVLTPFDKSGEVNVSQLSGYIKFLSQNGVTGAYIIGTTGEGYNLTVDEKIAIAREWRRVVDELKVEMLTVVNVSSTCLKEAVKVARECERIGIDAVAVLPPIYYNATSVNDLVNYIKYFGNAAPEIPLVYYHIPSRIGELSFDIVEVVRRSLNEVPQFTGMKFTDTNVTRFSILQKNFKNDFKIWCGFDECLLSAMTAVDCNAAICALFNLPQVVKAYKNVVAAVQRLDLKTAREEQNKIIDECQLHQKSGNFFYSIKTTFNSQVGKANNLDFGLPRPPIYYP